MSIIAKNVTKLYGQQKALDNVSFEINSGEVIGFLGPNGAGKSTMMKIITCYLPQTEGEISVCGQNISEDPIAIKRIVGYLPEHNPLYLDMYVKEYLEFCAGIYKLSDKSAQVKKMIDTVGLGIEQNKKIGALSKGYRQRVGLAQALIHNPKVLILDEPTTGLDPNQIVEIRNLIKNLGKEKTVMLSTHIMQEVKAICDRVIIVNKGKIVADDSAENVSRQGNYTQVIKVEFDKAPDEKELKIFLNDCEVKKISNAEYRILSKSSYDIRKKLFEFAVSKELAILSQQLEEQSLEDAFRNLTK